MGSRLEEKGQLAYPLFYPMAIQVPWTPRKSPHQNFRSLASESGGHRASVL